MGACHYTPDDQWISVVPFPVGGSSSISSSTLLHLCQAFHRLTMAMLCIMDKMSHAIGSNQWDKQVNCGFVSVWSSLYFCLQLYIVLSLESDRSYTTWPEWNWRSWGACNAYLSLPFWWWQIISLFKAEILSCIDRRSEGISLWLGQTECEWRFYALMDGKKQMALIL